MIQQTCLPVHEHYSDAFKENAALPLGAEPTQAAVRYLCARDWLNWVPPPTQRTAGGRKALSAAESADLAQQLTCTLDDPTRRKAFKHFFFFLATPYDLWRSWARDRSQNCDLSCSFGNAGSLTHCPRPETEPVYQRSRDAAHPAAPQQELLKRLAFSSGTWRPLSQTQTLPVSATAWSQATGQQTVTSA